MTVCSLRNDNLLSRCVYSDILNRKFPPKNCFAQKNLTYAQALKLSPVGRGYQLDGWPTANIVLKVHTLFFLFFFFFFAYYVVLLLTVYWKADLALFLRPDLEKEKKQRTNMARCSSPENYYSSGRNTELELCRLWSIYRRGNRQTKKSGFSTV